MSQDFPKPGERDWISWDNVNELKQTSRGISDLSPFTQMLFMQPPHSPAGPRCGGRGVHFAQNTICKAAAAGGASIRLKSGPFVSCGDAPSTSAEVFYASACVLQLASFAWMVERIIHYRRERRAVLGLAHAVSLAWDFAASPAWVGSPMQLRF